ncbi:pentapeptide repeat-containing protein [Streptomyces atroolivaceus]|uniref:pentapeptide repeat-containing protein n=1 Tax=Streptomyces atroolivaceus TaxID=66869 RepID=UPI00362D995E
MSQPTPNAVNPDLEADCGNCFGLCCVALPFARSADFAANKAAGTPCGNLRQDFRCGIHERLRDSGYNGCTVFDCFGAGQKVSQVTFEGRSWREEPASADAMYDVFPVMRHLHELLRYIAEATGLPAARPVRRALLRAYDRIDAMTRDTAESLLAVDVPAVRGEVNELLLRAGELARAEVPGRKKDHRGADLMGKRMRNAKLRGASMRGARLIAADLSGADLREADLIGADLRDTNLCGADLTGALFLTQPQLNAARGDLTTRIPAALQRPGHWGPGARTAGPAS